MQQVKALLTGYQSQSILTQNEQKLLLPMILGLLLNGTWLLRKHSAEPDKVSGLLEQNTQKIQRIKNDFNRVQTFFADELFCTLR